MARPVFFDDEPNELRTAILIIQSGQPLPVDRHARLLEMGYDVDALIDQYTP